MALTRPQYQPVAKDHVDEIPLMETGNQPGDEAYDSDLEINTSEILDTEVKQDNISRRTLIRVLAANGVIQIPIWGFAISYGVLEEYYFNNWSLSGNKDITGAIGTTANGIMYLSMPFLFALFTRRWAYRRQYAAVCGALIASVSFFLSTFSTNVWHLVLTQGVTSAFGCALIYSPITLSLGEWYTTSNRSIAYGLVLSCKNIVGTLGPFLLRASLDTWGFRATMIGWAVFVGAASLLSISLVPVPPSRMVMHKTPERHIPWHFLKHPDMYFYGIAIFFQGAGYGLPQTYLGTYAQDFGLFSETIGTTVLALQNAVGILASAFFGWLSDNKHIVLSAQVVSAIPCLASGSAVFLFWGNSTQGGLFLLVIFSITFGFFSSGYSATWGGILKQMENDSAGRGEAIDAGLIYGLINGIRGIGYLVGGAASVWLINAGTISDCQHWGFGSSYGPLILFTGLTSLAGGWVVIWSWWPESWSLGRHR
ncbi:major facilitator superfamily domain-containing protein [Fusarium acuminatum]|uniref:Major facilitator superfamily domain-containing protein n=1 Tax=Fusarium acuminatum TaxID=5515 RepID=A0ABZ2X8T8_9HYPO